MSATPNEVRIRADVDQKDANVCRFTVDRLVHDGAATFSNREQATENKLAKSLFSIPGISKVELNDNFVTVTKENHEDWRQIGKRIGASIRFFLNPPPEIPEGEMMPTDALRQRVQQIIDDQINPGVASHGGYVEVVDVADNNVFLRMGGGCQGCGAADMTLRMGVERLLREELPQIQQVFDATDHASGQNPYYSASK